MTPRDIAARWEDLAKLASGIIPNTIGLDPEPDEILSVADDLRLLAAKVDALIEAYAEHVIARTGHEIDDEWIKDQLSRQLEGSLLHEIQSAAEMRAMDMMEAAI